MHPVFATAREIAGDSFPALRPILSPSWTQPVRPDRRRRPAAGGKLVVARVHGPSGAFI